MKTQLLPRTMQTLANAKLGVQNAGSGFHVQLLRAVLVALCVTRSAYGPATWAASSTPPDSMTYQGFLVDANGIPLAQATPQNYPVAFRIYNASSGGTLLWSEQQIVTVDKGSFSVLLGEGTPIGAEPRPALSGVFSGATASDRYISAWVTIGGSTTEILPRLRLVPSPYSFLATSAVNLVQPNGTAFISYSGSGVNINGGNVGIGAGAPGKRLQIGDASTPNSEGMIRLASRSGTGGATRTWDLGVPETDQDTSGTGYSFVIDDTSRAGTEFMVQFGSGNVGIGTSNPQAALDVNGNIAMGNSQYFQARNSAGALETVFWPRWSDNVMYMNYGSGGFNIRNNSSQPTMFMQDNGNVGLGTLSPAARLDVVGNGRAARLQASSSGWSSFLEFNDSSGAFRGLIGADGAGFSGAGNQLSIAAWSSHPIKFFTGGTERMAITANGNVGIQTPSPAKPLQVGGPFGTEGMIRLVSSAFGGAGRAWDIGVPKDEASTDGKFFSFTIQDTAFADPALLIRWDSQNVGIGTTNPAAKLDVRGNIKLGASGQFSAAAGDENLRIIRGKVRVGAGNPVVPVVTSGSGFTVTRVLNYNNGTAGVLAIVYRIAFATAFTDAPAVTVSVTHDSSSAAAGFHYTPKVEFTSSSEAVVSFYNAGGNNVVDAPFSFIAVGAR